MDPNLVLQPMGALAALTFLVLLFVPATRMGRKQDSADGDIPGKLSNPNFTDLLEMPVLFYVICLMLYVTGRVDALFLWLAWIYVALRALHTIVHLSYNNFRHRMGLFALSNLFVIVMWVFFFIRPVMAP